MREVLHVPGQNWFGATQGPQTLRRHGQLAVLLIAVMLFGALPLGAGLGVGQLRLHLQPGYPQPLGFQLVSELSQLVGQDLGCFLVAGTQNGLHFFPPHLQDDTDLSQIGRIQLI